MVSTDGFGWNMLSADHHRPVLIYNGHCCPLCGLRWRRGESCLAARMEGGSWMEGEAKQANRQSRTPQPLCFPSLCQTPLSTKTLRCVEEVSPYHSQSFSVGSFAFSMWLWCPTGEDHSPLPLLTSLHTGMGWSIHECKKKDGVLGKGVCMPRELVGLSLLKVVEVLPRYFIFIVKYSMRMVDRGNFCSQPAIQKWKGCGLWMKGAREIDTHGASW